MTKKPISPSIILASESPRRRELLKQAGICFSVVPSSIDERAVAMASSKSNGGSPESYVRNLAEAKAMDVSEAYPDSWVIGADTIVTIDGSILEKPDSPDDARSMLQQLSGRTHQVFTGYCICCQSEKRAITEAVVTDVAFKQLTDDEIHWYVQTPEPYDKAGGYGIQGLGTFLVRSVNGSYTNVVGLPVCEVISLLTRESILKRPRDSEEYA
jgi:septum formation protein